MKTQAAKKPRVAPPPSPAPAGRGETVMAIDENRRLLNRYRFVEQEGMRLLAGWLPRVETFELKCELGRTIWEYSQHVNALYLRLREIQSPAFQTPDDAALVTLMRELLHAPNEFALAASIYRIVTPSLIRALETHEVIHLVAGHMTVTPDGGEPLELRAGDMAVFPRGWSGTWQIHETVRKVYAIF